MMMFFRPSQVMACYLQENVLIFSPRHISYLRNQNIGIIGNETACRLLRRRIRKSRRHGFQLRPNFSRPSKSCPVVEVPWRQI
jgi:hypothetical protein